MRIRRETYVTIEVFRDAARSASPALNQLLWASVPLPLQTHVHNHCKLQNVTYAISFAKVHVT